MACFSFGFSTSGTLEPLHTALKDYEADFGKVERRRDDHLLKRPASRSKP
jgi:hypothetical protein